MELSCNVLEMIMREICLKSENVSGLSRIIAIPVAVFNRLKRVGLAQIVSVSDEASLVKVPVADDMSFVFDEQQRVENGSNLYEIAISGFIPRVDSSPDIRRVLERGEWLVFCSDNNGAHRLCGTKLVPMRFVSHRSTGCASGMNCINFSFQCTQEMPTEIVDESRFVIE